MISRRELGRLALAAPAAGLMAARIDSKVNGVMLGAQSYSFRDRSLDECVKAMAELGLGYVELYSGHIQPKGTPDEQKRWRTSPPMDEIRAAKRKFEDAGIEIYALNYSFRENFSDEEIASGFEIAKALGTNRITASSNVTTAKRIDPFAQKAKVYVGMHNHSNIKPNEFARPEDFEEAMKGQSKYIAINLDIGHFTAAGYDPVDYLQKHHGRTLTLHIKDRKKDQGPNVVFGEGDTPIKPVLQVLKEKRYRIPAMIEYEYRGQDTMAEMRRCVEYCKQALA